MCQLSCLQTILQSYSHPDSMVLAQKQKYRPMKPVRKPIGFCVLYFHFHLLQGILDPPFDFFFALEVHLYRWFRVYTPCRTKTTEWKMLNSNENKNTYILLVSNFIKLFKTSINKCGVYSNLSTRRGILFLILIILTIFFFLNIYLLSFLATPWNLWDLISLTRDWTPVSCIGSTES